jgi:hypothetical protein
MFLADLTQGGVLLLEVGESAFLCVPRRAPPLAGLLVSIPAFGEEQVIDPTAFSESANHLPLLGGSRIKAVPKGLLRHTVIIEQKMPSERRPISHP